MSNSDKCFILGEATISLYPASPVGDAVVGSPVWMGGCAEGLKMSSRLEGVKLFNSGDRFKRTHHTDERHEIAIDRLWVLPRSPMRDYRLERNQMYALEIIWVDPTESWFKRVYFGVTGVSYDVASQGVMQFMANQVFDAERIAPDAGQFYYRSGAGVYTPAAPAQETPVLYAHDGALLAGDPLEAYLVGHYRWATDVGVTRVSLRGRAGQGVASVFALELGGVTTGTTITMAAGAVNAEVVVESTPSGLTIPANTTARWKCVSGPANVIDCAWATAIVMTVV